MRRLVIPMIVLVGLTLGGCDLLKQIPNPFAEKPPTEEKAAADEEHATEPEEDTAETVEDEETAAESPEMAEFPYEEIEVPASDGVPLQGRLYDPYQLSESEEEPSQQYPLVILLHGLNRDRTEWDAFPKTMVEQGMAVLAIDQRGHGRSTRDQQDRALTWRLFEQEDWQKMPQDVGRILRYFRQSAEDYPQVDASKVALVGSKLGANVALLAADKYPDQIKAVVLLSPAIEYKNLNLTSAIIHYPNATFIAASQIDSVSFDASQKLYRWALGPKAIQLYKKIGDGSDMLRQESSLEPDLSRWLAHYLLGKPTAAEAEAAEEKPAH